MPPPLRLPSLEPLEVHSGMVFGSRRTPSEDEPGPESKSLDFRETLEEILIPALSRTPCLVAFSGGRDSSAMLAMAARTARRHGLDEPVPITITYPQNRRTWESQWQQEMVQHLGLWDWQTISVGTEFDILGTLAREALERHGLYWPSNAHAMIPLLEAARGGSLITGNGGDELFLSLVQTRRFRVAEAFRALPPHKAMIALTVPRLPTPWRVGLQFRGTLRLPWLRPAARDEVRRHFVARHAERARTRRHHLETWNDSRYLELIRSIFSTLARDAGALLSQPFLDPRLSRAVLAGKPPEGFPTRNAALEAFLGDLLPPAVAQRTSKASFTEVFWGPQSRNFARQWDGTGLDPTLVDPAKLRAEWAKPKPDARAQTPLQAAWFASVRGISRP